MHAATQPACPVCGGHRTELFAEGADWRVRLCGACGHGRTLPELSDEEIAGLYPDTYLGDPAGHVRRILDGSIERSRSMQRTRARVELLEGFCSGGRILDVGCGGVGFLATLDGRVWTRSGIEPIAESIEAVRPVLPEVSLHVGTLLTTDLPAEGFDCLTFWHVLEHVEEPRAVLEAARRLLAPGGIVLVNLPNFDSYQARLFRRHWYSLDPPRHRHHFTADSLGRVLEEAGFQPQRGYARYGVLHPLKHSLLKWSESTFSSRLPYYLLKPAIFPFGWLERKTTHGADLTMVGRKVQGSAPIASSPVARRPPEGSAALQGNDGTGGKPLPAGRPATGDRRP